jgi:two-component system, NtrC family, sensor kinase
MAIDAAVPQRERKLSEAGARIARVVHEMNVPLSLIAGSLEQLEQYTDASVRYIRAATPRVAADPELGKLRAELEVDYLTEHALELIEICREGARRLDHVVQQLRVYARNSGDTERPVAVDLATLIDEAISLAGCGRDRVPRVERQLSRLPRVTAVARALSQAFVNVLSNAFDAVSFGSEPRVWVSAGAEWEGEAARRCGWVEVVIRDNGPGVAAPVRPRIFEAFFTTKPPRSGMGLGLAIAKEIIETHGGTIALAESDAPGSVFVIRLPIPPEHFDERRPLDY